MREGKTVEGKDKKSRFNLYNLLNRERDLKDAQDDKNASDMGFLWFFKLLGRRLSTIFSVNILFVLGNFPIFFILIIFSGIINDHSIVPQSLSFSNLYGALAGRAVNPLSAVYYGIVGSPVTENEYNVPLLILFICLSALLLVTFGPVNCGCAHILRSVVRRDPVFLFQDFFGTIKKNFWRGLFLGILDLLFAVAVAYDIFIFYLNYSSSFFFTFSFFFSLAIAIIYLMARPYMYLICITFKLKFFKLLKNSAIFAFLGIKRNILALIGKAILVIFTMLLLSVNFLMAVGALLPLVILFGLMLYMGVYAAYKVIKIYMIDPYYDEEGNPLKKNDDEIEELNG